MEFLALKYWGINALHSGRGVCAHDDKGFRSREQRFALVIKIASPHDKKRRRWEMRADNRAKMCGITGGIKNLIPTLTMDNEGAGCAYGCCGAMGGYFALWQRRGGMQKHAMRPAEAEDGR